MDKIWKIIEEQKIKFTILNEDKFDKIFEENSILEIFNYL